MVTPSRVDYLLTQLTRIIGEEFPDITVAELLSVSFTMTRGLVRAVLDSQNDEHNRAELLRCLQDIQQDVWLREPTNGKVN